MLYTCPKCNRDNLLRDEVKLNINYNIQMCNKCSNKYWKNYRENNRDKINLTHRMVKYGITVEEHNKLLKLQLNSCAICKRSFDIVKEVVDHNHKTNEVRGILCYSCNAAIGFMKENEDLIWNMLEYLKRTTWSKVA
jgi:DNA-directed RNA polymerase subunit RPC12/RpoP